MEILIKAAQLFLSLSILVLLHEFGHYIPARIFKTRVEKFYLFFNPWFCLFKKKIGDTEWGIGWLPLGGFVKIAGMIDESMDKEQMALPPQPWEFRSKPAWQRLIIMLGGVFVNFVVGFIIYISVIIGFGKTEFKPQELKNGLGVHPYFEQFGLKNGDNIVSLDGESFNHYYDSKYPMLDLNNDIFLRGVRKLGVVHPDGKKETIVLPDDIDRQIFTNSVFPIFTTRGKNTGVSSIISISKNNVIGLEPGDELVKVNKSKVENYSEIPDSLIKSITVLRNEKEVVLKIPEVSRIKNGKAVSVNRRNPLIDSLYSCFPAMSIGLCKNDKVIKGNNVDIKFTDDLLPILYANRGKNVEITILRNKQEIVKTLHVNSIARVGFAFKKLKKSETEMFKVKHFGIGKSIRLGINEGKHAVGDYVSQLKFLFTKKGAGAVGGFASIGKMFPSQWDWKIFWLNTAFISMALAFMNILPIPALDGGHVVFLLYEIVTGKEAPQKVLEYAQYVGIFILLGLTLYANGNDLFKWITG